MLPKLNPRKLAALLILQITFCFAVNGQQKPVYSQYMYNMLALNPAYAGVQKELNAKLLFRQQWVNFEGAPSIQTLGVHSALKNRRIGLGLQVSNERIGAHNDLGLYASYAYHIVMDGAIFSMGLQAGFNKLATDFNKLNVKNPDPYMSGVVRNFNPNFGTGFFLSTSRGYAGFSIPYLATNKIYTVENVVAEAREARYYFLAGGYVFDLAPRIKVKPSGLLRVQEGAPLGFDINGNIYIDEVVDLGVSYRSNDAVVFLFAIQTNENFRFGYAYDHTLSAIGSYSKGSHELLFNYRIALTKEKCQTYF